MLTRDELWRNRLLLLVGTVLCMASCSAKNVWTFEPGHPDPGNPWATNCVLSIDSSKGLVAIGLTSGKLFVIFKSDDPTLSTAPEGHYKLLWAVGNQTGSDNVSDTLDLRGDMFAVRYWLQFGPVPGGFLPRFLLKQSNFTIASSIWKNVLSFQLPALPPDINLKAGGCEVTPKYTGPPIIVY